METKKRIFVTGASGFIGENLCVSLTNSGHEINALVRDLSKSKILASNKMITFFQGDLHDEDILRKASKGCDIAYHIAAFAEPWHKDPNIYEKVNVGGTKNVLDACIHNNIQKVVFTSTAGVFGPSFGESISEISIRKLPLTTLYEQSKEKAEELVRSYTADGIDIVIVNPTRVFGHGQISKSNAATMLIDRYRKGKWRILPGNGSKLGNYVHIDDVVKGHILAMEKGKSGENYLLGGESVSYRQFFKTIANETGKHHWLMPLSSRIIIFVAYMQDIQASMFKIPPQITSAFARKYMYDWDNDSSKAMRELGYTPKSFKEGVQQTLNWLDKIE